MNNKRNFQISRQINQPINQPELKPNIENDMVFDCLICNGIKIFCESTYDQNNSEVHLMIDWLDFMVYQPL